MLIGPLYDRALIRVKVNCTMKYFCQLMDKYKCTTDYFDLIYCFCIYSTPLPGRFILCYTFRTNAYMWDSTYLGRLSCHGLVDNLFSLKVDSNRLTKNGPTQASFCLFSSFPRYNFNNTKWNSIDGVLGIWTRGGRMVGADETTELWRPN